ncbi:hypothetical protein M9H77_08620 [Catharanthus roseus]|uniref:Uncharacterized protein n=1 Tax=Catharanthus roseus TaxID=4058 RepID=A0ACC0BYG7_CATRO|nr:hypothetical protein M9H77_08620 [Catharanthus roseus]
MQEQFTGHYHCWFEVPSDVYDMWWGDFRSRSGDWMRDLLGDAQAARKRPVWIPEMFWRMRVGGSGSGEIHRWFYILHRALGEEDLTERFSKSRHLEELHKHQTGNKKGQYVDFHSEEFWKAEEKVAATGAPMPRDLQLMSTISGGLSRGSLYGAGSEAAHLRAESSQTAAGLPPCYLETEQRIMRQVEAIVPVSVLPSTNARVSSSTPPPPSIDASGTNTVDPPPSPSPSSDVRDLEDI